MRINLVVILLLIATMSFGQNCKCDSVFLQTQKIVEDNYAGWFDKVNENNRTDYNEWTEEQWALSRHITKDSLCARQLQEWISFFKDKHLTVKFINPKISNDDITESKDISILTSNLTESAINSYFAAKDKLDPIEGIYESYSYKLGVTEVKPNVFYATIISTTNENWQVGEVKLVITKVGNKYEGVFYEGDKSDMSTHDVKVVDNILDFDIVFYEKTFPKVESKIDIIEYEMSKDKYAPSLVFRNNVAIWSFPSFENNAFEQTEYLLQKYKDKLDTTNYWVLDLSNNSGGDYRIGLQLLDYIYTNPIVSYNAEMRMTPSNYDIWYRSFVSNYYESLDTANQRLLDGRLNKMKANYGKMYLGDKATIDTLKMETIRTFPQHIALLINTNTVSSGELFTMIARQSSKVKVMGENSGGMMDYGNVVNYKTNCSAIRIQLPTNRQLWLNEGISVDKAGLAPDIYLNGTNWIDQAIEIMQKQ